MESPVLCNKVPFYSGFTLHPTFIVDSYFKLLTCEIQSMQMLYFFKAIQYNMIHYE